MRRSHALLVTAITLSALSACGSSDRDTAGDGSAKVATLTSPEAKESAAPKVERPRERLDSTPEEAEALYEPYIKCMEERGVPMRKLRGGNPTAEQKKIADKSDAAERFCGPRYLPLPPWEKDPANPESRDFARDVVKCLKNKGIKYVGVGDNGLDIELGGAHNDSKSIMKGLDLIPGCERQTAAKLKK